MTTSRDGVVKLCVACGQGPWKATNPVVNGFVTGCLCSDATKMRKALEFIAADKKMTVDHLRGYADGVLQGLDAMKERR